jgi:aspartate-semialdehyde dehydrogenase
MPHRIAIVGSTGLVGQEMEKVLKQRLPAGSYELKRFASRARPEEKVLDLEKSWDELAACPFVLGASSDEVAREVGQRLKPGQVFVDNSSAFRMEPNVPLVVPEVNGAELAMKPPIVANPNCTTIFLVVALKALESLGIERVVASTYQAASGAGLKGLEELEGQLKALGRGEPMPKPEVFPFPLAGNVLSHNSSVRPEGEEGAGYNGEEWKVCLESRRILGRPGLPISATCIRVPVLRAHCEAVSVDFAQNVTLPGLRALFARAAGVKVVDEWNANRFPMPLEASDQDDVLVGRIRVDPFLPKTAHFFLSGDQIRKGAATNAIQILERYF